MVGQHAGRFTRGRVVLISMWSMFLVVAGQVYGGVTRDPSGWISGGSDGGSVNVTWRTVEEGVFRG